ncbi:uracil phosphoribosyltransferase [Limobrevibacterium gyesilva]|uniref:Uracil phosphoribosyltransferase n=1 Tax=Limobrevibacterium gyesilva TaxID=2991712 RepID=A0AA41YUD4_9PROT|nr:uracil phosphoribosyltransferase [Limobrevibacterium gyesilva]MCW3475602.1 uracil phosphoribosyltransferase [Limobrevibacterium gyesilva]
MNVTVLDHPLIQHKLTLLRDRETSTAGFRRIAREMSMLMAYEVTRGLKLEMIEIETPLERMEAPQLSGKKLCFVSILRAGNGILEGMLDLVPGARVGHIGLYRDPQTLVPVEYYLKLPDDIGERMVIVVDPMLATGHSAAAAVGRLKQAGAAQIRFACLLAAPEGLAALQAEHGDVEVFTCAVDRQLDDHGYIRPGLGDAGDRLYGTK